MHFENSLTLSENQEEKRWHCIVCGCPLETSSESRLFCVLCSTLGDLQLSVEFVEGSAQQRNRVLWGSTGRTGRWGIGVAVLQRSDGLVHFEFDLYRTNWNLRPEVRRNLTQKWEGEVAKNRDKIGRRKIRGCFSKTFASFDVLAEFADGWRALVGELLSTNAALEFV